MRTDRTRLKQKTDAELLTEIHNTKDDLKTVELMMAFYRDSDRANRASRSQLYFHLGTLCGMILNLTEKKKRAEKKAAK